MGKKLPPIIKQYQTNLNTYIEFSQSTMSNLINKAKDALSSNKDHSTTTTHGGTTGAYDDPRSTNAGPHSSNIANKADPRIDSDRDNRNDPTSRVGGYGTQGTHTGTGAGTGAGYGTTGVTGTHGTHGTTTGTSGGYNDARSTNAGPHSSNLANKLDPRVDSDRDNRNDPTSRVGGYGTQDTYGSGVASGGAGGYGTTGHGTTGTHHATTGTTTGAGIGGTSGAQYNDPRSTNTGPHSSNLANKLDPKVDSDRDNRNNPTSGVGGYGQTQQTDGGSGLTGGAGGAGYGTTGHTGTHGTHGTTGTHGVTGTHGAGTTGGYGTGTGPTQSGTTTAHGMPSTQKAAHDSALLNRLDPRVKSDKEGNPTH